MKFTIERKYKRQDFEKLYADVKNCRGYFAVIDIAVVTLLYLSVALCAAVSFLIKSDRLIFNGALVLVLAACKTHSMLNKSKRAKKWAERQWNMFVKDFPDTSFSFEGDKLSLSNEIQDWTVYPKDFHSVFFADDAVYIYLTRATCVYVFESDFSGADEWQSFYDFAKANYCKTKRVYHKGKSVPLHRLAGVLIGAAFFAAIVLSAWVR